jgi:hypothetical protein
MSDRIKLLRSPRYPRIGLEKAVALAEKIYDGVHTARVDADTAARIMGYSGSANGSAASAIGTLRQFKLVDGLRGDLQISDLGLRILQPIDAQERFNALQEAAFAPDAFSRIRESFPTKIPSVDDPMKAVLIRHEGFSSSGAEEAIASFRETFAFVERCRIDNASIAAEAEPQHAEIKDEIQNPVSSTAQETEKSPNLAAFRLVVPLSSSSKAEVTISGEVSVKTMQRLIQHLELLKETLSDG